MDIDQQVLDAFQIEHREQLQRIRELLTELDNSDASGRQQCIDEAFRMAHSLKGGARVCDLRPAETLGHGLETMFARLREGDLDLDRQLAGAINVVLDGIEDWMAALCETATPPAPVEAMRALEPFLQDTLNGAPPSQPPVDRIDEELRDVFLQEYPRYTEGLGAFLQRWQADNAAEPQEFDEAFRLAHDLRASARAARLDQVQRLAEPLEQLFRELRDGSCEFTPQMFQTVQSALRDVEAQMSRPASTSAAPPEALDPNADSVAETLTETPPGQPADRQVANPVEPATAAIPTAAAPADAAEEGEPVLSAAPIETHYETVRVRADSLDRLLQSSSQLMTESLRQEQVTRQLAELQEAAEAMQREREAFRRAAGAALHRLDAGSELRPLARYLEMSDQRLQTLVQHTRKLQLTQQRSSWLLRSHSARIQDDIRQARMVSADNLFQAFPKMVRDLARGEGKQVEFQFVGSDVRADRLVLQALKDPVMHMLRNAVIHGVEPPEQRTAAGKPPAGRIRLVLEAAGNQLQIRVEDDGRGIDLGRIAAVAEREGSDNGGPPAKCSREELTRLIFEPGFSTSNSVTELAGRGMGLSVVHEVAGRLQGSAQLHDGAPGTVLAISVPLSICTHRLLWVAAQEQTFAVPLHAIECLKRWPTSEIETLQGTPVVMHQKQLIPLVTLAGLVGLSDGAIAPAGERVSVLVLRRAGQRMAVVVDEFLEERDALVQELDAAAARPEFAGALLSETGAAVLVVNPSQLFDCEPPVAGQLDAPASEAASPSGPPHRTQVLVVDDSFTTRTLEKSILETHGYQVHVATDGIEALDKLQTHQFDVVISDLEMPRLDGFELLEEMKRHEAFASIPVILVTSRDCADDQRRGLALGAEAYIVKRKFDHQDLLTTIEQLTAV